MVVSEEELNQLLAMNAEIEKVTLISSDGKRLLTRLPKDIVDELKIKKGDKFRWLVKVKEKKIILEVEK